MPIITETAIGKRKKFTVFGNDYKTYDGTCIRDYIHVVDIANAHLKTIEFIQPESKVFVLNLGTGKGYSVLDIVREFELASNQTIPYEFAERRKGDVAKCYADPSLAFKLLDWKTNFKLSQMCEDAWNWEKSKPI